MKIQRNNLLKWKKFSPLREWLACALGLYVLKDESPHRMEVLVRINAIAAEKLDMANSLTPDQKYSFGPSKRTIQANNFFQVM